MAQPESRVVTVSRVLLLLRVLWASPYTLLGLTIGGIGLCAGGRVRRGRRAIEFCDGGIRWFLSHLPQGDLILAMTLGHTILAQTEAALEIARRHEEVHVAQYERWGPLTLPVYYGASIYLWLRGKRFYRDNPFEREASGE